MNYYEHHIGDYIKATAHLSMLEDAAYRRLIDAYYTKEAPLPSDRKACHRLARATSKPERDAVDTILDEFFVLADDGWHQSRCDEELAKYREKRPAAEEKRENDKERQRRARERRKRLFEELSSYGINMHWNATTEMLQAELSRVTSGDLSQRVTQHVTRDNTATQTPDTRHQTKNHQVDTHTQDYPTAGVCVSTVSDCCKALVNAGIPATKINQGHPKLLALIEAGATAVEFGDTARECIDKGNPAFAYVLGTMTRRREQAAATQLHKGAMPRKPTPGQRSADAAQRWLESQPQEAIEHDAKG